MLEIVVDDVSEATSLTEPNWLTEEAVARMEEVLEIDAELVSPLTVAN